MGPYRKSRSRFLDIRTTVIIAFFFIVFSLPISMVMASPPLVPPGYSSEVIHVKFREGTEVQTPEALLPPDLRDSVASISRLFSLSKERLEQMGGSRLNLWFRIVLRSGTDAGAFLEHLKQLDSVEIAEPAPLPAPPPR